MERIAKLLRAFAGRIYQRAQSPRGYVKASPTVGQSYLRLDRPGPSGERRAKLQEWDGMISSENGPSSVGIFLHRDWQRTLKKAREEAAAAADIN